MSEEKEKLSSISVEKTASGKFVKAVKLYFDKDKDKDSEIIERISLAFSQLNEKFKEN